MLVPTLFHLGLFSFANCERFIQAFYLSMHAVTPLCHQRKTSLPENYAKRSVFDLLASALRVFLEMGIYINITAVISIYTYSCQDSLLQEYHVLLWQHEKSNKSSIRKKTISIDTRKLKKS